MANLVVENVRQRPLRTLVSVIGVALGVCLVMLFTGLSRGMSNDLQRRSSNVRAEISFTRPGSQQMTSSSANLDVRFTGLLKNIEGVADATPVILYISQGGAGFGFEQIEGVDWDGFARMNELQMVQGRAPQANDEVIIDETKARNSKIGVGDKMKLFGDLPYKIVGIYSPESRARVKMSLAAMQDALTSPGKCTYILIKCKNANEQELVAARINKELPDNSVQLTKDVVTNFEQRIPFLGVFLRALVGLAMIVSALIVMLAMYTTITERTREIGILKALGASRGFIVWTIEKEALLISLIGLVIGFATALLAGFLISRAYGLVFEYGWQWAVTAAVIGLLGGALGALYPAVRAANLDPVNALAYE